MGERILFAALNAIKMASLPWSLLAQTNGFVFQARLDHMEPALARREWLAEGSCVADMLMADILRLVHGGQAEHPACLDYVLRATARPPFRKAYADQMAHFAAAD